MGRESACWNAGGVDEVAPAVCEGMAAVRLEGELVEGEGEESEARRARVPPSSRPPGRALKTRKPVAPVQSAQRGWRMLQSILHGTLGRSQSRVSRGRGRTRGEPALSS